MDPSSPRLLMVSVGDRNRQGKGEIDMSPRADHRSATAEQAPAYGPAKARHRLFRAALNVWIVFHVAAIIIAPAAVSPSSDIVQAGWDLFQPYLQVLD